jgi:hypothetical protein
MGIFNGLVFAVELGSSATFAQKSVVHKTISVNGGKISFIINETVTKVLTAVIVVNENIF